VSEVRAYLLAVDKKSFADHKWDFGFVKEAFIKNKIDYEEAVALPECEKAFVVICGYENRHLINEVSAELKKVGKVVLFITGDERGVFRADKISHPDIKIWIQSPYPDRHGQFYKMPIGCPSHMRDNLPEYTNKKNSAFFSGQITHDRRKELAEAIPNVPDVLFNPTAGFTQGYEPKEYYKHLLESKVVPAPAGTATIDSFRFYEALEMLALPIGDLKNSVNEEQNFWDFTFEQSTPFIPKTNNWHEVPGIIEKEVNDYPANMHRAVNWWIRYKRDFAYKIMEQINE
jgi:hypothetical protein